MQLNLKVQLLVEGARAPKKGKLGDAGYDLWALESGGIPPGESFKIRTGFATEFNHGFVGLIRDRGSTGFKGIMHQAGVVDANYRGEWIISLYNTGPTWFRFDGVLYTPNAKAIAQVIFCQIAPDEEVTIVKALSDSARGAQGFGSSDKKE